MRKFIAIAICAFMLCGCAKSTESDLPQNINTFLTTQSSMEVSIGANRSKDFYKYYLPFDIGVRDSTELGEVFIKNESMILMNFDPSAIVIYNYYDGKEEVIEKQEEKRQAREDGTAVIEGETTPEQTQEDEDTKTSATTAFSDEDLDVVTMDVNTDTVIYQGTYQSNQGSYYPYKLNMMHIGDNYLLYLDGSVAEFYCTSPFADVQSNLKSMFLILKSITYDTDYILENFSMKKATSSKQQSIDTLQQNLPSAGSIPELLEQMEQLNGNR